MSRSAFAALGAALALGHSSSAVADCAAGTKIDIFGLPIWATDPNEGNTWGVMPIVLGICPDDHRTLWIFAPSVTWNSIIHYTATLRWYQHPDRDTNIAVLVSGSTQINYRLFVDWQHLPPATGAWTDESSVRVLRSVFAQFFGLGPATPENAESSYTLATALATERVGRNIGHHLNLGGTLGIEHDTVEARGVSDLPLAPAVFPNVPGMRGSTLLSQGLDLRYDSRDGGDYADSGVRVDLWGQVVEGLVRSPTFLRGGVQANGLWPELSWLAGSARANWSAVSSSEAPFYAQSQLGGAFLLRGFDDGRFIDRQAWTIELEQRIRLLQTRMFGVVADWRLDPFVAAGQVFGSFSDALSRPRYATGVGFRVFVRPSILGRLDVATGDEGLKIYVEIGYPY